MKKFSFLAAVCALLVAAAPALAATELSVFAAALDERVDDGESRRCIRRSRPT